MTELSDRETKPGHRCLSWIQEKQNIKFNKLQQEIGLQCRQYLLCISFADGKWYVVSFGDELIFILSNFKRSCIL